MKPVEPLSPRGAARRELLNALASAVALTAAAGSLGGCGGGGTDSVPVASGTPTPTPTPTPAVARLQRAIATARPLAVAAVPVDVSQSPTHTGEPSLGSGAVIVPPPRGFNVNPNPVSLIELAQVWGHARQTWVRSNPTYMGSTEQNASWWVPVKIEHRSSTLVAGGFCAFHFVFSGRSLELLIGGTDVSATLIADGEYMSPRYIATTLEGGVPGVPLNQFDTYMRFDFASPSTRHVSLYIRSSVGPCAFATAAGDSLEPWDRSGEPSMCVMADSYAGAPSALWSTLGLFFEAATALAIPHLDASGLGGTGYAPNNTNDQTRDPGNMFGARIAGLTQAPCDLFLTAGGINDDNNAAAPPLYASAEAAAAAFDSAVKAYYRDLRTALPDAVLAAIGPWQPRADFYPESARAKADTIRAALQAISGPWVFIDNLQGGWINSAGASAPATGTAWQTGTGNVGNPKGDGNGDLYVSADGTHPTEAGSAYLGAQLAANLRAAILAL